MCASMEDTTCAKYIFLLLLVFPLFTEATHSGEPYNSAKLSSVVIFVIMLNGCTSKNSTLSTCKARKTLHQPLTRFACSRAVFIHYLLLANAIYARQIYRATAIKNVRVVA